MDWRTDRWFDFSIKILYNYNIKNFMAIHDSLETSDPDRCRKNFLLLRTKVFNPHSWFFKYSREINALWKTSLLYLAVLRLVFYLLCSIHDLYYIRNERPHYYRKDDFPHGTQRASQQDSWARHVQQHLRKQLRHVYYYLQQMVQERRITKPRDDG